MRLRTRFTLIGIFIIIFLVLAPWLVFYALGYKYDFGNKAIVKTGTLVVQTEPENASIYIDEKLWEKDSPANIRFLLPGDYQIRVEKEGFQPWAKRLNIKPQLVTWANLNRNFISLFLNEPQLVQTFDADQVSLAKNQNAVGLATGQQLQILWTDNGNLQAAGNYSKTNFQLPIEWENTNQIFSLNRTNLLSAKQIAEIHRIETSSAYVALDINHDLYLIREAKLLLVEKAITGFDLESNGLWYIQNNSLKFYNLETGSVQIINDKVPEAAASQIRLVGSKIYAILDDSLYVLNDDFEKVYSPASSISWDSIGRQVLITNSNELAVYDPGGKTTELILRSSAPITQAALNSADGYIFFVHEGKLKAIELDGRDQRNAYIIFQTFDSQNKFTLSADGKFIYVISPRQVNKYLIR